MFDLSVDYGEDRTIIICMRDHKVPIIRDLLNWEGALAGERKVCKDARTGFASEIINHESLITVQCDTKDSAAGEYFATNWACPKLTLSSYALIAAII